MTDDVTAISYDAATYYGDVTCYCVPPTCASVMPIVPTHTHTHTRMRGLRRSGRNLRRSVIANIVDMLEYFGGNCEIINRVSFDDNSAVISLLGV